MPITFSLERISPFTTASIRNTVPRLQRAFLSQAGVEVLPGAPGWYHGRLHPVKDQAVSEAVPAVWISFDTRL